MSCSELLSSLYNQYSVYSLKYGKLGDKLGDCFESFIVAILQSPEYLARFINNNPLQNIEYDIFCKILWSFGLSSDSDILEIEATSEIMRLDSGGLPKTDVIATVFYQNRNYTVLPISIKQSTVAKVAFAEFDVDTIVKEVGISDKKLIELLYKHQNDGSAKNFTEAERLLLTKLLAPHARRFVQWVVTGAPNLVLDERVPQCIVRFHLTKKTYSIDSYGVYSIPDYVKSILMNKHGAPRRGGFGTGLSWTYATGSKGKKIQFKG